MDNFTEEEIRTFNALTETPKGITDIMKINNLGYYKTQSILTNFVKIGMVEPDNKTKIVKYKKKLKVDIPEPEYAEDYE